MYCYNCGVEYECTAVTDNGNICDRCASLYYKYCFYCCKYHARSRVKGFHTLVFDGVYNSDVVEQACLYCIEFIGWSCTLCNHSYQPGYMVSEFDGVCENCVAYCDTCTRTHPVNELNYCESCGGNYCNNCSHDCEVEDENWTPPPLDPTADHEYTSGYYTGNSVGKIITIDRLVGLEIEVQLGVRELVGDLPEHNGIHFDRSIEPGIEVVTPPLSLNLLEYNVNQTTKVLTNAGYKATAKCGLHVHLDARDFMNNPTKVGRLIKVGFSTEDLLFSGLPFSRWRSRFCKRLSIQYDETLFKAENQIQLEQMWYKSASNLSHRKGRKYDDSRYCALNIHGMFHRGAVEFRHHSGTVNAEKILYWTQLILKIVDYSLNGYNANDVHNLYRMATTKAKLQRFYDMFDISPELREYWTSRIEKFNPEFYVKFTGHKDLDYAHKKRMEELQIRFDRATEAYSNSWNPTVSIREEYYKAANELEKAKKPCGRYMSNQEVSTKITTLIPKVINGDEPSEVLADYVISEVY